MSEYDIVWNVRPYLQEERRMLAMKNATALAAEAGAGRMKKPQTRDQLEKRRAVVIADLLSKVDAEDWHGVQDCASDIREIDAMLEILP